MEARFSAPITCSGCGSSSFSANSDGAPLCDYCGAIYAPTDPRCPRCDTLFDPGDQRCLACGAVLSRECPICGTLNPLTADRCLVCSQTLNVTEAMFARLTTKMPDQLKRVREAGAEIKAKEERASAARLAKMWADENQQREEEARARGKREHHERLIMTLIIGLIIVAIITALMIAFIASSSSPALV